MVQFMRLATPGQDVSTLLDFAPLAAGIQSYQTNAKANLIGNAARMGGNAAAAKEALNQGDLETGAAYQRMALQDKQTAQMDKDRQIKVLGAGADAVLFEKDPTRKAALWNAVLKRAGVNPADLDAEELDPITGPQAFKALSGRAQDPRESQLMDLKLAQAQKDLTKPTSADAPSSVQEYQYFSQLSPEQQQRYLAMKRASPLDKAYATQFNQQILGGGMADATKNLSQLQDVQTRLESGKENLTGPGLALLPDSVKAYTNPASVDVKDTVEEVVQRNLREILGAQFTQKEGERLIARAFNPALEEKENARRLARLNTAMQEALRSKQDAAAYYQQNGTIQGFKGKTNWTVADFEKAMEGNTDTQLPILSDPAQARGLPKGTRFKTPDGRVMEVP